MTEPYEPGAFENRCPVCQSKPGEKCTVPTDTSRRPVNWFHYGRRDAGLK